MLSCVLFSFFVRFSASPHFFRCACFGNCGPQLFIWLCKFAIHQPVIFVLNVRIRCLLISQELSRISESNEIRSNLLIQHNHLSRRFVGSFMSSGQIWTLEAILASFFFFFLYFFCKYFFFSLRFFFTFYVYSLISFFLI